MFTQTIKFSLPWLSIFQCQCKFPLEGRLCVHASIHENLFWGSVVWQNLVSSAKRTIDYCASTLRTCRPLCVDTCFNLYIPCTMLYAFSCSQKSAGTKQLLMPSRISNPMPSRKSNLKLAFVLVVTREMKNRRINFIMRCTREILIIFYRRWYWTTLNRPFLCRFLHKLFLYFGQDTGLYIQIRTWDELYLTSSRLAT